MCIYLEPPTDNVSCVNKTNFSESKNCATTKTDTAERSISIDRESLQVFFLY